MGRLLITGASGNLGRPLSALAASSWETTGTYLHSPEIGGGKPAQLDLRNQEAALELVLSTQPNVIIHAATSDRSTDMARTNQAAAQHITEAARTAGCRLIALLLTLLLALPAAANPALEAVVSENLDQIEKPSRRTVEPLVWEPMESATIRSSS